MSLLNALGFATAVVLFICPCRGGRATLRAQTKDTFLQLSPTMYQIRAPKVLQPTNILTDQGVAKTYPKRNDIASVNGSTLTANASNLDINDGAISTSKNSTAVSDRPKVSLDAISSTSSKPPLYFGNERMYQQTPQVGPQGNVATISITGELRPKEIVANETISNFDQSTGANSSVDVGSDSLMISSSGQEVIMNTGSSFSVQRDIIEHSTGGSVQSGTPKHSVGRIVQAGNTEQMGVTNSQPGKPEQSIQNNLQSPGRDVQPGNLTQYSEGTAQMRDIKELSIGGSGLNVQAGNNVHMGVTNSQPGKPEQSIQNNLQSPGRNVQPGNLSQYSEGTTQMLNNGRLAYASTPPVNLGHSVNEGTQAVLSAPAQLLKANATYENTGHSVDAAQSGNAGLDNASVTTPETTPIPKILTNSRKGENIEFDNVEKIAISKILNGIRKAVGAKFMYALRWNESLAGQAWMDVKDCVYKNRRNGAVQAMIHEKKTGNSMFSEAVSRWSDEKNFFDPYMPCNVRNSCRYSQLVWATSREVGCARKKCNDMSFITCMYYPVGNTAGYTAYVEGTRCEGCKNSCNSDKLCEWPPNSQPQQGSAFGTPPMGQNRFGNQPMMQQPFF